MKFHAPTKQFVITTKALEDAAITMLYTIASIRKLANRRKTSLLSEEDHAMRRVIDTAEAIGIDLGAKWGHELDVSDYAN